MPASVLPCTNTLLRFIQHINRFLLFAFLVSSVACSPATPTATPETFRVQYSFATQPWLEKLSGCADGDILATELRPVGFQDPQSTDLVMRIGQPEIITTPAFQFGTEDLIVIVNRQNPINRLSADQVRGLFSGRIVNWKESTVKTPRSRFGYFQPARMCNKSSTNPFLAVVQSLRRHGWQTARTRCRRLSGRMLQLSV